MSLATLPADLVTRRETHFLLWRPSETAPHRCSFSAHSSRNPPTLRDERPLAMRRAPNVNGLWHIAAADCSFTDGDIVRYWFEVNDTHPHRIGSRVVRCTDPAAHTVDWRLTADSGNQPASVVQFSDGRLTVCDPGREKPDFGDDVPLDQLPANANLVIYELPTAWTRSEGPGQKETAVGTFRDVLALVDEAHQGANFAGNPVLELGRSYLSQLGVNALELLPPADSFFKREWGYDTAHFLAPDHDLGRPEENTSSTANADLAALIVACHRHRVRFFVDMVMAFGRVEPYQAIDFDDFCIEDAKDHAEDPDALTSGRADGHQDIRDGFGSILFRYTRAWTRRRMTRSPGRTPCWSLRVNICTHISRAGCGTSGSTAYEWIAWKMSPTGTSSVISRIERGNCGGSGGPRRGWGREPMRAFSSWAKSFPSPWPCSRRAGLTGYGTTGSGPSSAPP